MKSTVFPVIDSTLSPQHLSAWVAEQYGLANVSCKLLKANINDSYKIRAGDTDYLLRVYHHTHRSRQDVQEEVRLLTMLNKYISVSYPIPGSDGAFVYEINAPEGIRSVVLFSFAMGSKVRHLSVDQSHAIGVIVGKFHQATAGFALARAKYDIDFLVAWAHTQLRNYIPADLEEMKYVAGLAPALQDAFSNVPLTHGTVHLDIWYDNMSITSDDTITLFDFDNCGNGWLILDIGYYCMQLFYVEQDKAEYEQKKAAFIAGYRSVASISNEELTLVPHAGLAIWIHYMGIHAQRFDNLGNLLLSENYFRMMIGRVKGWLQYNGVDFS